MSCSRPTSAPSKRAALIEEIVTELCGCDERRLAALLEGLIILRAPPGRDPNALGSGATTVRAALHDGLALALENVERALEYGPDAVIGGGGRVARRRP